VISSGVDPGAAASSVKAGIEGWPGVRTLRSARFRLVLGVSLWMIGVTILGSLMISQARNPMGGFGIDFADYRTASLRMIDGQSPYAPEMLSGPVAAQGIDRYRYPPPFAQLLTPVAILPFELGAVLWLAGQALLLFGAVWLAALAAGARPSIERFVWTGVALTYFLPVFDALFKGNVNGLMALSIAVLLAARPGGGGRPLVSAATAGGALGAAAALKLAPIAILPAAIRGDRRLAAWTVAGLGALVLASLALAPQAWRDYATVLPNLLAGSAGYANNLAPSVVALGHGASPLVGELLRAGTVAMALALVATSVWSAGRSDGWPTAVACGVIAGLLVPAAIWYQSLTLLLPSAAFAWVKATAFMRWGLVAAGAMISIALAWLPLVMIGVALLAGSTLYTLWPRER